MSKPILLDLFCCAGGAGMGYHRAGFDVLGVDRKPQPNYPFWFYQGDALAVLRRLLAGESIVFSHRLGGQRHIRLADISGGHASPPCQSFTAYRLRGGGVGDGYENLIPETRELLELTGLPYVIENVPGAPLEDPLMLCGSSFGLDVRRHRLFETSFPMLALPCDHSWQTPRFPPATNRTNLRSTEEVGVWRIPLETQQQAMGIDWMELHELTQAIPPAYTDHIGRQLLAHINEGNNDA